MHYVNISCYAYLAIFATGYIESDFTYMYLNFGSGDVL